MLLNSALISLFLSTPSARRATCCLTVLILLKKFLSTPSARRATPVLGLLGGSTHFYPRPPRGGRPLNGHGPAPAAENFYPRPPRGGRHLRPSAAGQLHHFYPRPPRGGRHKETPSLSQAWIFLSTPSARRATGICTVLSLILVYFYPRPPRGGRHSIPGLVDHH